MNPRLTSVQVLPNFRLSLVFNNGENRLFDVGSYVKNIPALQRLTNPVYFVRRNEYMHTATLLYLNGF